MIESFGPINFMKEVRMINRTDDNKDTFNLDRKPFGGRSSEFRRGLESLRDTGPLPLILRRSFR